MSGLRTNGKRVAIVIAAVAVFAGVYWLAREPELAKRDVEPASDAVAKPDQGPEVPAGADQPSVPAPVTPKSPVATDPRLAALIGAPGDPMVEYLAGPDGRVIKEVDKDPNSQGHLKPLREYTYAGGDLVGVTVYKYLGTQVQVIRAAVTYHPDGSVDQFRETTDYQKP